MPVDKAALLDAIARGGTAAKNAYLEQQAKMQQMQQASVQAALSNSVAQNAPVGADQQIKDIIGSGYYVQDGSSTAPYYGALQAAVAKYVDEMNGYQQLATKQYQDALAAELAQQAADEAEKAAAKAARGGGGGGGGGSTDWWKSISDQFDTKTDFYNWLDMQPGEGRTPSFQIQQSIASELGVPEGTIEARIQPNPYITSGSAQIEKMVGQGKSLAAIRKFLQTGVNLDSKGTLRNETERQRLAPDRRYLVDQAKTMGAKPVKKAAKPAAKKSAKKPKGLFG